MVYDYKHSSPVQEKLINACYAFDFNKLFNAAHSTEGKQKYR